MMLEHLRDCSETYASASVRDAVLTVPAFYTQHQRRALIAAAELAGMRVLGLVDENVAAGVRFGMERKFNESHNLLIYNVGAMATQATIIQYSSRTVKEAGRNKTIGDARVLGKGWDAALGGEHYTRVLVEAAADAFNEAHPGVDIRTVARPIATIKKHAEKLKTTLSANEEFPLYIESLHQGEDFRFPMSRSRFEELAAPLLERQLQPVRDALDAAGLEVSDLDAVEIIGGGVRIPAVKALLRDFFGESLPLGVHLNGDEAVALGAAFVAANRSTAFRVRKVGMTDATPFPINVRLSELADFDVEAAAAKHEEATETSRAAAAEAGEEFDEPPAFKPWRRRSQLFRLYNHMPSIKKIAFPHVRDFQVDLHYNVTDKHDEPVAHTLPEGTSLAVASYTVTGVEEIVNGEHGHLGDPKVTLSFQLDHSGVARLMKAEATLEEIIQPEPEPEDEAEAEAEERGDGSPSDEESAADESDNEATGDGADAEGTGADSTDTAEGDAESDASAESDKEEAEEGDEGGDAETKKDTKRKLSDKKSKSKKEKDNKPRKKTHRFELVITEDTSVLHPLPLEAGPALSASKSKLRALTRKDEERKRREEARNDLESFIFGTKDKFYTDEEDLNKVSTEEQRDELNAALDEAFDWLEFDGEDASTSEYREKRTELNSKWTAIEERLIGMRERPEAVANARDLIEGSRLRVGQWEEERPQINETERQGVLDKVGDFERWLNDVTSRQEATPLHEAPVFTKRELAVEVEPILTSIKRLERRPKPKPKVDVNATATDETEGEEAGEAGDTEAQADSDAAPAEGADEGTTAEEASDAEGSEAGEGEDGGDADAAEDGAGADETSEEGTEL
mmetsp:Transcript_97720/g.237651  ORF Transcript_97720/g.237651 Transcript_97720/m.237651 type:complete len:855 (+) Transcript_97720:53-2617(+)